MIYSSQNSRKKSVSQLIKIDNKQNQLCWVKGQRDINKVLSSFHSQIQQSKAAITDLQNQLSSRQLIPKFCQLDFQTKAYDRSQDEVCTSINETRASIFKRNNETSRFQIDQQPYFELNEKIQNLQRIIKRREAQEQLVLEQRLSEKGDKTEIQKSLNLAKLLAVQISQIQQRFKENQKMTKLHEQLIEQLTQKVQSSQNTIKYHSQIQQTHLIEEIKDVQKQNIKNQFETIKTTIHQQVQEMIQRFKQSHNDEIQDLSRTIHELKFYNQSSSQKKFQELQISIDKMNQVLLEDQNHSRVHITSLNLQLGRIQQENKRFYQKTKKNCQTNLNQKLQDLQKSLAKKFDFLRKIQSIDRDVVQLRQNLEKISSTSSNRQQRLQRMFNTANSLSKQNHTTLLAEISLLKNEQDQLSLKLSQVQKSLSKYAKTQSMKQYFSQQNQKVYQIINSNFQEQKVVNETLCSQNIVARWLWEGEELKGGNLVAWNKEIINTLPQNFRFDKEKSTIIEISNCGIYKFQLGFYAKKKPTIQILINGKTVMSAVNSSSYVLHHSSGKLKSSEPTQIAGLTLTDFFLIPQNSRIAIAYVGDVKGEGFLNIQRL